MSQACVSNVVRLAIHVGVRLARSLSIVIDRGACCCVEHVAMHRICSTDSIQENYVALLILCGSMRPSRIVSGKPGKKQERVGVLLCFLSSSVRTKGAEGHDAPVVSRIEEQSRCRGADGGTCFCCCPRMKSRNVCKRWRGSTYTTYYSLLDVGLRRRTFSSTLKLWCQDPPPTRHRHPGCIVPPRPGRALVIYLAQTNNYWSRQINPLGVPSPPSRCLHTTHE